jgi:hypothetical protein
MGVTCRAGSGFKFQRFIVPSAECNSTARFKHGSHLLLITPHWMNSALLVLRWKIFGWQAADRNPAATRNEFTAAGIRPATGQNQGDKDQHCKKRGKIFHDSIYGEFLDRQVRLILSRAIALRSFCSKQRAFYSSYGERSRKNRSSSSESISLVNGVVAAGTSSKGPAALVAVCRTNVPVQWMTN